VLVHRALDGMQLPQLQQPQRKNLPPIRMRRLQIQIRWISYRRIEITHFSTPATVRHSLEQLVGHDRGTVRACRLHKKEWTSLTGTC
jgi:hypothetical protein